MTTTVLSSTPNIRTERIPYVTPMMIVLTLIWLAIYSYAFPDPVGLAARNWPIVLVGLAAAVVGNVTAIGGGLVFIPVFTFIYQLDALSALKLAFVTQAVGMTSGATGWLRRGHVPMGLLEWTIPGLLFGTMISTFLVHPSAMLVKSLFGPVSLVAGIVTLWTIDRRGELDLLPVEARVPVLIASAIGGLITGWVAIGEGEIIAAFCMLAYGLKATKAIGLGVVLLAANSIVLGLVHAFYFGGVPWELAAFTMLGVLWGGRLGPYLAQFVSVRTMKKVFATIAIADGALITFQALKALL